MPKKLDPLDMKFEGAVIGCAMLYPKFLAELNALPEPSDFETPGAEDIWRAILDCWKQRGEVITARVIQTLRHWDYDAPTLNAVAKMVDADFVRKSDAKVAAAALIERTAHRRALSVFAEAHEEVSETSPQELGPVLERVAARVLDLTTNAAASADHWVRIDAIDETVAEVVPTGWASVDRVMHGWPRGTLSIIAGRPGMGKSAFAVAAARRLAAAGHGVGINSLEMRGMDLRDRMAADQAYLRGPLYSGVSNNPYYSSARRGELQGEMRQRFFAGLEQVRQLPIMIDERKALSITQIRQGLRALKARMARNGTPLDVVFIDHLQHIRPDKDRKGNRASETTDISAGLMEMAGELNVCMVALAQLNRAAEGRTDKRPVLSDLRESGSLEQDAHNVLLLYRPAYYLEREQEEGQPVDYANAMAVRNVLEVNIAKQRNGPTQVVEMFCEIGANAIADADHGFPSRKAA